MWEFEAMSVAEWSESGLVTRARLKVARARDSIKASRGVKGVIFASAVALSVMSIAAEPEAAQLTVAINAVPGSSGTHSVIPESDLVPKGYWSKLLHQMQSMDRLQETDWDIPDSPV